jgi:hypothetical protein
MIGVSVKYSIVSYMYMPEFWLEFFVKFHIYRAVHLLPYSSVNKRINPSVAIDNVGYVN